MWKKNVKYFFDILKIIPLRRLIFKWSIFELKKMRDTLVWFIIVCILF